MPHQIPCDVHQRPDPCAGLLVAIHLTHDQGTVEPLRLPEVVQGWQRMGKTMPGPPGPAIEGACPPPEHRDRAAASPPAQQPVTPGGWRQLVGGTISIDGERSPSRRVVDRPELFPDPRTVGYVRWKSSDEGQGLALQAKVMQELAI